MAWGNKMKAHQHTVSLTDLRTVVADRLQAAQRRLDPASVTAAFAEANASHHDNMIGSLIFGMVCWAPFMSAFGSSMNTMVAAAANSPVLSAAADGLSMVYDEKAYKNRRRRKLAIAFKDGVYHGGRKQVNNLTGDQVKRKFNMVAANENSRFAKDAAAEVAGMAEMLDMIDRLEQRGATMVVLDRSLPVSASLAAAVNEQGKKPALYGQSYMMHMAA